MVKSQLPSAPLGCTGKLRACVDVDNVNLIGPTPDFWLDERVEARGVPRWMRDPLSVRPTQRIPTSSFSDPGLRTVHYGVSFLHHWCIIPASLYFSAMLSQCYNAPSGLEANCMRNVTVEAITCSMVLQLKASLRLVCRAA